MYSKLQNILNQGDVCVGGWLTIPSPLIAEAMASCGLPWIACDLEHGPISEPDLAACFMAMERHNCSPMVRLPSADPFLARRLLDLGAVGFFIPVVESAHAFKEFAKHCYFPPKGRRGVGLSRVHLWGDKFGEYNKAFNPVLVPQIETKAGVAACPEIATLDETAALFLGPYDLSASLGTAGDFDTKDYRDAVDRVKEACLSAQKPAGIHQVEPDLAALQGRIDEGFRLLAYATDMIAMRHAYGDASRCSKQSR